MFLKYKLIVLISLLVVISANEQEKDNSIEKDILEHKSEIKNPSKRGALYNGHGFFPEAYSSYYGYQIPNYAGSILNRPSFLSGHRPVAFSAPAGFGASIQYANTPSIFGSGISPVHAAPVHFGVPASPVTAIAPAPSTQYAIRPGGAIVQSYNVNYPQLSYHHKHYPQYAVAAAPVPAPIAPAAPLAPVNNFHYHPTFAASPAHIGFSFPSAPVAAIPYPTVAPIAPQHFFINRPPAIGIQFPAAPAPTQIVPQRPAFVAFGTASPVPQRPAFVAFGTPSPAFPSVVPIASGSALAPGQIPASTAITPTNPTTLATPWRPIVIHNSPTATPIPQPSGSAGNRPPISLLPPYGAPERPNEDFSHYYQHIQNQQNQEELLEQNYYADQSNKGYHY